MGDNAMNERIKEIALECYNPYTEFDHEKFAEMIVNECITLVNKIPVRVEPISGQNFKYIQLGTTIDTIKDHFGVE